MRITLRGFAAATVGLVSAVGLAGCSGNSTKPTVLPTLSSTTAASARTSTSLPASAPAIAPTTTTVYASDPPPSPTGNAGSATPDPLAEANKSIAAAVKIYYATLNKALRSNDAEKVVPRLFTPMCQQCVSDYNNIKRIHDKRWTATGGDYKLLTVVPKASGPRGGAATITFTVDAITVKDAAGKVVGTDPAQGKQSAALTVAESAGRWLVVGYIDFGRAK